jgi:hypothetical protein
MFTLGAFRLTNRGSGRPLAPRLIEPVVWAEAGAIISTDGDCDGKAQRFRGVFAR